MNKFDWCLTDVFIPSLILLQHKFKIIQKIQLFEMLSVFFSFLFFRNIVIMDPGVRRLLCPGDPPEWGYLSDDASITSGNTRGSTWFRRGIDPQDNSSFNDYDFEGDFEDDLPSDFCSATFCSVVFFDFCSATFCSVLFFSIQ